ncbi:hypothetical protein [Listeria rocourtiae]|uniref:hypothetical protein n=1 Tax=Listeria rocourtiae TaxID=647910 RepID=UPI0003E86793|nr:hypothetical protein [Listeria rocourtiae]EUJ43628.1 hypothetical protein PROCOU_15364 [Listeria rocourtiae FSL F6-920]
MAILSGCGLYKDIKGQIEKTTPKITRKSAPSTKIKTVRTDFQWNGAMKDAEHPAPQDFLNNQTIARVKNNEKIQITVKKKVKLGVMESAYLSDMMLTMIPESGVDVTEISLKELESGVWQFQMPSKSGKYMYILKEFYGVGVDIGYYVTYYFGLEVTYHF